MRNRGFQAHIDLRIGRQKVEPDAVDARCIAINLVDGRQQQMMNWRLELRAQFSRGRSQNAAIGIIGIPIARRLHFQRDFQFIVAQQSVGIARARTVLDLKIARRVDLRDDKRLDLIANRLIAAARFERAIAAN